MYFTVNDLQTRLLKSDLWTNANVNAEMLISNKEMSAALIIAALFYTQCPIFYISIKLIRNFNRSNVYQSCSY